MTQSPRGKLILIREQSKDPVPRAGNRGNRNPKRSLIVRGPGKGKTEREREKERAKERTEKEREKERARERSFS